MMTCSLVDDCEYDFGGTSCFCFRRRAAPSFFLKDQVRSYGNVGKHLGLEISSLLNSDAKNSTSAGSVNLPRCDAVVFPADKTE